MKAVNTVVDCGGETDIDGSITVRPGTTSFLSDFDLNHLYMLSVVTSFYGGKFGAFLYLEVHLFVRPSIGYFRLRSVT